MTIQLGIGWRDQMTIRLHRAKRDWRLATFLVLGPTRSEVVRRVNTTKRLHSGF